MRKKKRSIAEQRKTVVVLCAAVACMAAPLTVFARRFPRLSFVWLALMVVTLVYAIVQFKELKRREHE